MSPSCQVFLELRNMFSFVKIAVFDEILRFGKIFSDGRSPIFNRAYKCRQWADVLFSLNFF